MTSYLALKQQAQALAVKIEQARLNEVASVIARTREVAAENELSAEDIFGHQRTKRAACTALKRSTSPGQASFQYRGPERARTL